jgi:ankyrin repeat protein
MNKTRGLLFTAGIVLAMAFTLSLMSCALSPVNQKLLNAASCGGEKCLEDAKEAISQGANVNVKNDWGLTPLSWAIYNGNVDMAKLLIEKGANVNARSSSPLSHAATKGNVDMVKLLIESGANVNAKDKDGFTPLDNAVGKGNNIDIVKLLVEKGANVNAKDGGGFTPLITAAYYGNIDIVKFLIESGAKNVNAKNKYGKTALYYAIAKNDISMVEFLMENGATFDKGKTLEEFAQFVQEKEQKEENAAREKQLKREILLEQKRMWDEYDQTQNQAQSTEFDAGEFANAMTNLAIAANNLGKSNTQQPNQYQQNQYQNSQYQNTQQDNGNCQARYDRWTNQADKAASNIMKMDKAKSTYTASQKNLREVQREMRHLRTGSECKGKITKSWLEDAKPDAPVRSGSKYQGQ